jgi:phosphate starvation-inducible PhoH-like protein
LGKGRLKETREPEIIDEISLPNSDALKTLCGERDRNLREIESHFQVTIHPRGNRLRIIGPRSQVRSALVFLKNFYEEVEEGKPVDLPQILKQIPQEKKKILWEKEPLEKEEEPPLLITYKNKPLRPQTPTQKQYVHAMQTYDLVFGIGPAGTGKTYLAVMVGIHHLLKGIVDRMILVRPAVEAGEKLGFLPGDLVEKVNPYLRPLYDALHDMLPPPRIQQMMEEGTIEVAPLAFMRGRTLNNAFVILDEAQNTTREQMKMFLTRIGYGTTVVVTGDLTQTDLPPDRTSGLLEAYQILKNIPEICFVEFTEKDVFRHPIVQKILRAYAELEERT